MSPEQADFWFPVIMFGGLIFALLLVGIFFLGIRWKTKQKIEKHTIVKELYNEKERKNGQSKSGSHGHY